MIDSELSELRRMCGLPDHQPHPARSASQRQTLSDIKRELDAESVGLLTMMRRVDADVHHCEWEEQARLAINGYSDMLKQRDAYALSGKIALGFAFVFAFAAVVGWGLVAVK